MTSAVLTYTAVRLYTHPPEWDGFEYQGIYQTIGKDTLRLSGIHEFPAMRSRTVIEIELTARPLNFIVNGDTEVKE